MPLRARRGEWDLLGLGVELRPQQVSLLRQDEGVALVPMRVPDPAQAGCFEDCGQRHHYLIDQNPDTGLWEPVFIPGVLRYKTTPDTQEELDALAADGELPNGYDLMPTVVGDLSIPLDAMPMEEIEFTIWMDDGAKSARVLWDAWQITEAQAADLEYHVALSLMGSDYEELMELAHDLRRDDELPGDVADRMTVLMETGDPTPYVSLPPHLAVIWERVQRSSRHGWAAINDAIHDPLRPWAAAQRPERTFAPWY